MLSPGEDGSLWAEYAMRPAALLTAEALYQDRINIGAVELAHAMPVLGQ
jgi:hypothetical protein